MPYFRKIIVFAAAALAVACGNVDAKGPGIEGGSGEPTVDITDGSNGTTQDPDMPDDDETSDPPMTNSISTPAFGESSIATADIIEFPSGVGSITRLIIADQSDICSAVPATCEAEITADGQALTLALFAGTELATGRYEVEPFDEEAVTAGTRVVSGALNSLSSGDSSIEITSGFVEVTVHEQRTVSGFFELDANGTTYVGEFRTDSCPALEELSGC